jgi:integral membrane protein
MPSFADSSHLPADLQGLCWIGRAEGTSTLLLFGVAMPLKYAAGMPMAVTIVGSLHGVLFLAYVAIVLVVLLRHRWSLGRGALLMVGAVVPFGPFLIDHRIPRWHAAR